MLKYILLGMACCTCLFAEQEKPVIAVSNYPLQWVCETLVGDQATVVNLTAKAPNPREWVPDDEGLKVLKEANLIILQGGGYEVWAEQAELSKSFDSSKAVSEEYFEKRSVSKDIQHLFYAQIGGRGWVDPLHLSMQSTAIVDRLEPILGKGALNENLAGIRAELNKLEDTYRSHKRLNKERILSLEPCLSYTLRAATGWKIKTINEEELIGQLRSPLSLAQLQEQLPDTFEFFPARMAVSIHPQEKAITDYLQRHYRMHVYTFSVAETVPPHNQTYTQVMTRNFKNLTSGYLTR